MTYSRKKFQEALKMLKGACKTERLPWTQRLRAAELICLIYGLELPGGSIRRDQKIIKELLEERAFEKSLRANLEKQKHAIVTHPEQPTDADTDTTERIKIMNEFLNGQS